MPSRSMDSSSTIKILYILHLLCLILSMVFYLFTFKYTVCAKLFKAHSKIMLIFLYNGYRNPLLCEHQLQRVNSHAILHYLKMQVVAVAVVPAADQHRAAIPGSLCVR